MRVLEDNLTHRNTFPRGGIRLYRSGVVEVDIIHVVFDLLDKRLLQLKSS